MCWVLFSGSFQLLSPLVGGLLSCYAAVAGSTGHPDNQAGLKVLAPHRRLWLNRPGFHAPLTHVEGTMAWGEGCLMRASHLSLSMTVGDSLL